MHVLLAQRDILIKESEMLLQERLNAFQNPAAYVEAIVNGVCGWREMVGGRWLVGWLVGWWVGGLVGWLFEVWLIGWFD
jgi:hypothetical protein